MEKVFSMDIFWGLIASASAWAFWRFTGEHGFQIITGAVLIGSVANSNLAGFHFSKRPIFVVFKTSTYSPKRY